MDDFFFRPHTFVEGTCCVYCKRTLEPPALNASLLHATRDHIWPHRLRHLIPPNAPVRVWSCFSCNQIKADMSPRAWCRFMRDTPHWWTTPDLDCVRGIKAYYATTGRAPIKAQAVVAGIAVCRRVDRALIAFPDDFESDLANGTITAGVPYILSYDVLALLAVSERIALSDIPPYQRNDRLPPGPAQVTETSGLDAAPEVSAVGIVSS